MKMYEDIKKHLMKALERGIRYDGRKPHDFREISVEIGVSESAEGSARVRIGQTDVIAGVKLSVGAPYPDTPDQGNLVVNTELLAISNPEFQPGPPGEQAVELSRIVDRGIRESKAIDSKKLCITPGEKVWSVMIDICTINDDGNLIDAAALAALAALKDAKFPKYEDDKIDYMKKTNKKLPIVREPICVTIVKIGSDLIVDPLPDEEKVIEARLSVTITQDNKICALQKGRESPLAIEDIDKMVSLALKKAPELRKKLTANEEG